MPVPNDPCCTVGGEVTYSVDQALPQIWQTRGIVGVIPDCFGHLSNLDSLKVGCQVHPKESGRCASLPEPGESCRYGYVVRRGIVAGYL